MTTQRMAGMMLGIVEDDKGKPFIAFGIGNVIVTLSIGRALIVFEQLGSLLEEFGVFEDEGELEFVGSTKCH